MNRGLKRLYDYNYQITNEGTLSNGINLFKNELNTQNSIYTEYLKELKDNLIEKLKKFLEGQVTSGRQNFIDFKDLERGYKCLCDNLEKNKLKFHSFAKQAEESKLHLELAKNNQNLSNDQKNKHQSKLQLLLRQAIDAEKAYIENINSANIYREKYIEDSKKILNEFQKMEEEYIDETKKYIKLYFEFQFILYKNLSTDYERKCKQIDTINTQADIREFIEKNATNFPPPYKFEFIPYSSEVQTKHFEQTPYSVEIINNVKNFISNQFCTEIPEVELDVHDMKNHAEIQDILNSAWEGKLSEEEKKAFLIFIKEKKYRKHYLNCMNKYRISGLFTVEDKSFAFLGELLGRILDEATKDKDYECAKFCMIISQTFYKVSTDPNKSRIFLQEAIETHEIWKITDFWEGVIKYSINDEAHGHKAANTYQNETSEDKLMRIQSVAFGQLLSFSFNMLSFLIPKEKVKDTINNFCKIYKIPEEMSLQILKSVDDYTETIDKQVKMDIIDDNFVNITDEVNDGNCIYV